ncbi:MAG: DUF4372 domain-containing protein [Prevotellaceae bacterium]|jgi:hypothetical protein|nr:DUF4372 domain-containing protein [Prevotellaceae bacterium]
MFQNKYVFAQMASFLNRSKFDRILTKYSGGSVNPLTERISNSGISNYENPCFS